MTDRSTVDTTGVAVSVTCVSVVVVVPLVGSGHGVDITDSVEVA